MDTRFDTRFFEQYAQISLSALLGSEYDCLVNRDRPDLQSAGSCGLGIEVTRAMEQSKHAHLQMLQDVAGLSGAPRDEEVSRILETGYAYGLGAGRYVGVKELAYWNLALPMRRILESKVSKVSGGFYGKFDRMGLFVFSRENLNVPEALSAMRYTLLLQVGLDIRYDRLYIADVDDLFECNLEDGIKESARLVRHPITQEQRKAFFDEAIRRQQP